MLNSRRSALCLLLVAQRADAGYTWAAETSACGRISEQSNIWTDANRGFRWNFDLHVQFPLSADPEYMEKTVRVEFSRPLTIESVDPQGAVIATNGGDRFVEVQVSPSYVGHEYFSIHGFREGGPREDLMSPSITCSGGADVPPPAPPHAADCDLMPTYGSYPLGGTREAGSVVTLKLARWTPFRAFTLVYYGQEGLLVSKMEGGTIQHNPQHLGDALMGFSFALDPQGSQGLRCDGHPACIEFEVTPQPHHKPHITCVDSPPPIPPSPPPVPPPMLPLPPPVPSPAHRPSPPPPATVRASAECALGGSAKVVSNSQGGTGKSTVRIVVTMDAWSKGYVVTLGLSGEALLVTHAIHAIPQPQGPLLPDAMRSFSFKLEDEPIELPAFAVVLETRSWGRIAALTCSAPVKSPPPPRVSETAQANYYGDDTSESNDGSSAREPSYGDEDHDNKHLNPESSKSTAIRADESTVSSSSIAIGLLVAAAALALGGGAAYMLWQRGALRQGKQRKRTARARSSDEMESIVAGDEYATNGGGLAMHELEDDSHCRSSRTETFDEEQRAASMLILGRPGI